MQNSTNILIVDDEKSVCEVLAEALSGTGFSTTAICSPVEALEIATRQYYDLALLDIKMPQMDGITLARELRTISPSMGIILITGYGSFENAMEAIKLGVSDFIEKPFNIGELLVSVNRLAERQRLEREVREKTELLRQSEEQYRILVDNVADGVALFSEGKIIFHNKIFSRLLGLESMTLYRRAMVDLLHPDDRTKVIQDFAKLMKNKLTGPVKYRFRKNDGTYCWVSVNSSVINYRNKPSVISTFRDITPFVEMEISRKDMEKMLRHDMHSRLVAIVGLANRLLDKTELSEGQQKCCRHIQQCGKQLEKMVKTYLNIVRLEQGSYKPLRERFNFMEIVAQVRRILRSIADQKNVDIVITFNKTLYALEHRLPFIGDKIYLQSALDNLIKNAIEASPENRSVKIKVKHDNKRVWVSMHNWGIVPEQIRACFFKKYATAGKKKGTGLGTYMAHLVVTSHGGSISFKSSQDEGTTVKIELPIQCLNEKAVQTQF
ncbi:MAG: response regulator [Deltaproteobacteria bacterium]|nr:response regulator [Deltaproteobacteria bacterium]